MGAGRAADRRAGQAVAGIDKAHFALLEMAFRTFSLDEMLAQYGAAKNRLDPTALPGFEKMCQTGLLSENEAHPKMQPHEAQILEVCLWRRIEEAFEHIDG